MNPTLTIDNNHKISRIAIDSFQPVHDLQPAVGRNGVTSIEAYNEFGQGEYGLWFAVNVGEKTIWRVNGKYVVEIGYA